METQQKIEELKFTIGRFDHFYDSVNNKGGILIALNTFIISSVIIGFNYIYSHCIDYFSNVTYGLFLLTLILNIFSQIYTISAFRPFTKKIIGSNSIIYFNSITKQTDKTHNANWESLTLETYFIDLVKQQKELAAGLSRKFKYLSLASFGLLLQIISIIIYSIHLYLIIK